MQYEDWKYHHSRVPESYSEEWKQLGEILEQQFLEELKQNPKVEEFLKPYHPSSTESFLKYYAHWKCLLISGSKYRMDEIEKGPELRYRSETEDAYKAILLKKLFNISILWRANQIELPGIEITWDLHYWEDNVLDCPFIEPVTAREIEVMQRYLRDEQCIINRYGASFTDFSLNELMDRDEEGNFEDMPEWFSFYDTYMGTGKLLLLPDIRGEREEFYRSVNFREQEEKRKADPNYTPPTPYNPLPFLSDYSEEDRYKLARLVEDDIFQKLFLYDYEEAAAQRKAEEAAGGVYDIEDIVMYLKKIPNPPPVRSGVSWREALVHCWQDYICDIVCEDLPLIWDEYKFLKETGLTQKKPRKKVDHWNDLSNSVKKQILDGRALCGEPRDFNF